MKGTGGRGYGRVEVGGGGGPSRERGGGRVGCLSWFVSSPLVRSGSTMIGGRRYMMQTVLHFAIYRNRAE